MSWLGTLVELHREKDAAYGDAWCRRGEAAGIFPNIARKYDRWQRIQDDGQSQGSSVEALDDTLADLTIYAVKYLLWLRERHPVTGPDQMDGCSTVQDALTVLASEPLAADAGALLKETFAALEESFVTPSDAPVASADGALRAAWAWDVARAAWTLLQPLAVSPTVGGVVAKPAAGQGFEATFTHVLTALAADLLLQLLPQLASEPGSILLLGCTSDSILLAAHLRQLGLGTHLLGATHPERESTGTADQVPWSAVALLDVAYLVVCSDGDKEALLRSFVAARAPGATLPVVVLSGMEHLVFRDEIYTESDAPAMVPSYATGYESTRIHMFQHLLAASRSGLTGAIVEFGAFKGGTTAWLARTARLVGLDVPVYALDSWDGFSPRRSLLDMYEHPRCVFRDLPAVRGYLEPLGVELIEGDISQTALKLKGVPILLGFVDTDNYSPAHAALSAIADSVVAGGAIVLDHFTTTKDYLYTLGERMAAQEVLVDKGFLHIHNSGVFLKLPGADEVTKR